MNTKTYELLHAAWCPTPTTQRASDCICRSYPDTRGQRDPRVPPGIESQEKQVRRLYTGGHGSPRS